MRLVDDGGSNASTDPPYDPTPTPGETEPSPHDSDSDGTGPGGHGGQDSDSDAGGESESFMPVAAQVGTSVGVIALAALVLIPGRRPPSTLRS